LRGEKNAATTSQVMMCKRFLGSSSIVPGFWRGVSVEVEIQEEIQERKELVQS
jgi:hypothetical protein